MYTPDPVFTNVYKLLSYNCIETKREITFIHKFNFHAKYTAINFVNLIWS